MRYYFTAEQVERFADTWPCCDLLVRDGWAEFDSKGDLVDLCPWLMDHSCEQSGGAAAFLEDLKQGALAQPVIFRVLTHEPQKGEVIALFPLMPEPNGLVNSYMHIGQHGAADYAGMIRQSRKATPEEYMPLYRELISAPYYYNLIVYDRKPRS